MKRSSNFKLGEKIFTDVCGPVNIKSPRGTKYYLLFKDGCTYFRKVYFLRHKSETYEKFREFEHFSRTQTGNKIKFLRSDNETEYTSQDFQQFVKERGILFTNFLHLIYTNRTVVPNKKLEQSSKAQDKCS